MKLNTIKFVLTVPRTNYNEWKYYLLYICFILEIIIFFYIFFFFLIITERNILQNQKIDANCCFLICLQPANNSYEIEKKME